MENEITITVKGGMVSSVKNVHPGFKVVVKDYDCDGVDVDENENVKKDDNGNLYIESVYGD